MNAVGVGAAVGTATLLAGGVALAREDGSSGQITGREILQGVRTAALTGAGVVAAATIGGSLSRGYGGSDAHVLGAFAGALGVIGGGTAMAVGGGAASIGTALAGAAMLTLSVVPAQLKTHAAIAGAAISMGLGVIGAGAHFALTSLDG